VWANELNAKDIHKEMFPVYGRQCVSRRAVTNRARNVQNDSLITKRLKLSAEMADTTVKRTSILRVSAHW
jgi:hypothetical protein